MALKYKFFKYYLIFLSIYGYSIENKFQTYTNYINHKYEKILWPPMFIGSWFLKDKVIKKKSLKKAYNFGILALAFEFIKELKILHNLSAILLLLILSYKFTNIKNKTDFQNRLSKIIKITNLLTILNYPISKYFTKKISDKLDEEALIGIGEQGVLLSLVFFNLSLTEKQVNSIKIKNNILEELLIYIFSLFTIF